MLKKKEQESGGKFFRLTVNDRLSAQSLGGGGGSAKVRISAKGRLSAQLKRGVNFKQNKKRIFVINLEWNFGRNFIIFIKCLFAWNFFLVLFTVSL